MAPISISFSQFSVSLPNVGYKTWSRYNSKLALESSATANPSAFGKERTTSSSEGVGVGVGVGVEVGVGIGVGVTVISRVGCGVVVVLTTASEDVP